MRDQGPDTLLVELACPKCGAPVVVDDETRHLLCGHCGSLLAVGAPGRGEAYLAGALLDGPADLRAMVVEYRVEAYRAQLVGSLRDRDGNAPPDFLIEARVRQFEAQQRDRVRVEDARRFHAPYWHIGGWIGQAVLGRRADGPKRMRLHAYLVEHTVPAYDTARVNLRDRGLRMARARVAPLVARAVDAGRPFLRWAPVAGRPYREIDRWLKEPLQPGIDVTARHGTLLHAHRVLVFRPYWIARVTGGGPDQWVLADGQFRTIAGYPSPAEAEGWRGELTDDPLATREPAWRRVAVAASRCPDCGHDTRPGRADRVTVCRHCHLALRPETGGLAVLPVAHAQTGQVDLDADYVPFWRFPPEPGADPGSLWRALFTAGPPPPGRPPAGGALWVPAVRLLGTAAGDKAFQQLVAWIHGAPLEAWDGKVPLGGRAAFHAATLDEDEARELLRPALFALVDGPAAARLTGRVFQRVLEAWPVPASATGARLVLVPFTRQGTALAAPGGGPAVSGMLVDGGPAVERHRVTVHAARRSLDPQPRRVF